MNPAGSYPKLLESNPYTPLERENSKPNRDHCISAIAQKSLSQGATKEACFLPLYIRVFKNRKDTSYYHITCFYNEIQQLFILLKTQMDTQQVDIQKLPIIGSLFALIKTHHEEIPALYTFWQDTLFALAGLETNKCNFLSEYSFLQKDIELLSKQYNEKLSHNAYASFCSARIDLQQYLKQCEISQKKFEPYSLTQKTIIDRIEKHFPLFIKMLEDPIILEKLQSILDHVDKFKSTVQGEQDFINTYSLSCLDTIHKKLQEAASSKK